MSSIIRVTDIGRPGFLIYMPEVISSVDFDFLFKAVGPTPSRSTSSSSYVTVDSGSFTIPSRVWAYPSPSVDHLFIVRYFLVTGSSSTTAFGRVTIDGTTLPEGATNSTSWTAILRTLLKKPSSTTINWNFQIRSSSITAIYASELRIFYCPVWMTDILYSRNIGANVLLTKAVLSANTGIRIDDEYCYRNTQNTPIVLSLNLLPFHKIEFFRDGQAWAKIEYVRVE
jgi:hypothetical protein